MHTPPKIIFNNQPKLSGHPANEKYDTRRLAVLPLIEELIASDELFAGKEVNIEFAHTGVSSLVCFIQTDETKYVLKIPLALDPAPGEARFLKEWESVGASVPHVVKEGKLGDHLYIVMSFIDAPMLKDVMKKSGDIQGLYTHMGETLRLMHQARAEGYGKLINGKAEFSTFDELIAGEYMQKMIGTVVDLKLLNDEHGPISDVISILSTYCKKAGGTSYCHMDFGTGNLMATTPLTVIDPHPLIANGIMDIGRAIQLMISHNIEPDLVEHLKNGYFLNRPLDTQALQAGVVLSAYTKFPYWHKVGNVAEMDNTRLYLAKNKYLLKV